MTDDTNNQDWREGLKREIAARVASAKTLNRERMAMHLKRILVLLIVPMLLPGSALATWSITAVDSKTKDVGIAGASCTDYVFGIAGVAPGKGVIVAQAMSNMAAKRLGIRMLLEGRSPQSILAAITDPAFDSNYTLQQYGIVALGFERQPATYTGADTDDWKGFKSGYGVTVQGNILTGKEVVSDALAAFEVATKNNQLSLADRLLAALEAGAVSGGDNRCGKQKARSAFLVVAKPTDDVKALYLNLNIPGQQAGDRNPIPLLRQKYDQWRQTKSQGTKPPSE